MSAYVVDTAHIDAILQAALGAAYDGDAIRFAGEPVTFDTADVVGRALIAENLASVRFRYPGRPDAELPGPDPTPCPADYTFAFPLRELMPVETIKAVDSFEYQACEHPGWAASDAKRFCDELRRYAIERLPGYDEAAWHIQSPAPTAADPGGARTLDDLARAVGCADGHVAELAALGMDTDEIADHLGFVAEFDLLLDRVAAEWDATVAAGELASDAWHAVDEDAA